MGKIKASNLYKALSKRGIENFYGVPDSLLKDLCAYITDTAGNNNICTANEGSAVAMATGYHLATGKMPAVYMQNSGFGNTVNPLLSLTHEKVYSIPMLLLIGWRGEPGVKDEPQHVAQGALQTSLLDSCEIPYGVLEEDNMDELLTKAHTHLREKSSPFAILVRKGTFEGYALQTKIETDFEMSRETAIKTILDNISPEDAVVGTTGMPSREIFEHRAATGGNHTRDFLTVGCMGHASQIAAGIALQSPDRQVVVVDGDGAALMHLGGLASIGGLSSERGCFKNFKHIIINNGAHDSVGGQPTVGFHIDFNKIAEGCGYKTLPSVETEKDLITAIQKLRATEGPCVVEVKVNKGARKDIGRPTTTPVQNRDALMSFLSTPCSA
eukprot:TRINITY_DN5503_c1_g2_i1.p1 TRINITY_DN5503_c1_g2~~TRINITY_DN5503_c1_g2_i1.p1  ORF type:complete len:384 (+),score=73.41 TRINITY_DN5503_c1_g2_i1:61-1212(+)